MAIPGGERRTLVVNVREPELLIFDDSPPPRTRYTVR
jgi:hypothetical protein